MNKTDVQYVRRSRFVAGLQRPELIAMLQSGLQSGALVVLEDDDYLSRFPDQERTDSGPKEES